MTHSFPTRRASDLDVGIVALAEAPAGLLAVDHRPAQPARLVIGFKRRQVVAVAAAEAGVLLEQALLHVESEVPGLLVGVGAVDLLRSEEHTSELQSLMRISYAVFCLKKKTK